MSKSFDDLTLRDVVDIAAADLPEAMDRNAQIAMELRNAYSRAESQFGTHLEQLRRHWTGAAASRFFEEAETVQSDVEEAGEVLHAHADALPEVAAAMRTLHQESQTLLTKYRQKRAQLAAADDTTTADYQRLAEACSRRAREHLATANETYHHYNNGWLTPPPPFRGIEPTRQPESSTPASQSPGDFPNLSTVSPDPGPLPEPPRDASSGPQLQSAAPSTPAPPPAAPSPVGAGAGGPGLPPGIAPTGPPGLTPAGPARPAAGRAMGTPSPGAMPPAAGTAGPAARPGGAPGAGPRAGVGPAAPGARPGAGPGAPGTRPGAGAGPAARPGGGAGPAGAPRQMPGSSAAGAAPPPSPSVLGPKSGMGTGHGAGHGGWGRNPWARGSSTGPVLRAPVAPRISRVSFGRNPWVRPEEGNAAYPELISTGSPPDEDTDQAAQAESSAETPADPAYTPEPPLDPTTLSRLLAEASPEERQRLIAVEAAKMGVTPAEDDKSHDAKAAQSENPPREEPKAKYAKPQP